MLDALLREDAPFGDLTTRAMGIGRKAARMQFAARGAMVACCVEEAVRMVDRAGGKARTLVESGDRVAAGGVLMEAEGSAEALHVAWKPAQTLVEYASGVATATARIVDAARAVAPTIVVECTRKTVPGSRAVAARAVLAGGGQMHRLGLSETLLVFAEHTTFINGPEALATQFAKIRVSHPGKRLTAEAHNVTEALALIEAGCDILQLDKLSPEDVRSVVEVARNRLAGIRPLVGAAGGITESNAAAYAAAGAAILVTSSPFWAKPTDVRVRIESR